MDFGSYIHQQCQGIGIVTEFFYRHTLIFILHEWPNLICSLKQFAYFRK